jgi:polygalacturonase
MKTFKVLIINILLLSTITLSAKDYKASIFGVKSEGITLNTRSIQKAIDFISENGGGRLLFYVGRYQTGTIQLKSNVTIQLEEGAVLVGTTSVYDYSGVNGTKALIIADNQENIGVTGKGVIGGSGPGVLEQIKVQIQKGYLKETVAQASPALIAMNKCSNITIDQFNLMNACGNVLSYIGCKNLTINGVIVKSTAVSGSQGMMFADCDGIKMTNAYFETSAAELSSAGTSKNVTVVNCKSATGKKLQATR